MGEEFKLDQRQSPTKAVQSIQEAMDFGSALKEVVQGKRIRRREWEDKGIYLTFRDETLMIFLTKDKMLHPLLVRLGDIIGEDWVVVE